MNNLKYVIDELGGFMIFPEYVEHLDAGTLLKESGHSAITGAGYIEFDNEGKIHCHGSSYSLGIESGGSFDDEAIAKQINSGIQE